MLMMLISCFAPPFPPDTMLKICLQAALCKDGRFFAPTSALQTFQHCLWGEGGARRIQMIILSVVVFFTLTGPIYLSFYAEDLCGGGGQMTGKETPHRKVDSRNDTLAYQIMCA